MPRLTAARAAGTTLLYFLLIAFGILMLMPFYWMIVSSLHTPQNLVAYPPRWWPRPAVLTHYANALSKAPFLLYYRNSLIVAVISVGLSVLLGLFAGYAFAIYSFPLKGFFFFLILATLMVPIQVTSVSLYVLMAKMNWIDTFAGILAPNLASAFGMFLISQGIKGMPMDLVHAARIDGAGEIRIVLTIIGPLVKSIIATAGLILFVESWNDFLWPVIIINSERLRTIPVGVAFFKDPYDINFGPLMAAASIATVPMIVAYLFVQKYIIKGIASTGLKF